MFKLGDTIKIEGYAFQILKLTGTRAGLAYTDENCVTHIRWVPLKELMTLFINAA